MLKNSVPVLVAEAGVQFVSEMLTTLTLDKAGDPSKVVAVVAGPRVAVAVPVQLPLTVNVFESPLVTYRCQPD